MALVRRHWKLALVNLLILIVVTAGGLVYWLRMPAKSAFAQAVSSVPATQPSSSTFATAFQQLQDYMRIRQLRQQLCLTQRDLVAMACTQAQATAILGGLKSWYQTNSGAWTTAIQQENIARGNLQEAIRETNAGTSNNSQSIPSLQQSLANAQQQTQQLLGTAASTISQQLSAQQIQIWQAACANTSAPDQYRYVPGLSASQAQQLAVAIYRSRSDAGALASAEQNILTQSQEQSLSNTAANLTQSSVSNILAAEQQVLPLPQSPTPQAPPTLPGAAPQLPPVPQGAGPPPN
jgi:hypothetical protein